MDWKYLLILAIAGFIGLLGPASVMLISWLKEQPWVKKLHLEDFFAAVIPQVVDWIEYWASQLAKEEGKTKPDGEAKMTEAIRVLREENPKELKKVSDDMIKRRIEVHLQKLKKGAA
jgi:hypothetical protein